MNFTTGLICCHLLHGLILAGLIFDYLTGAIPSVTSVKSSILSLGFIAMHSQNVIKMILTTAYVSRPTLPAGHGEHG